MQEETYHPAGAAFGPSGGSLPVEEPLADEAAMVEIMRRYASAKADHEERLERMRSSMLAFLSERNGGRKFSVPGLGTATTTTRTRVEIADEERFLAALPESEREELFDRKLNLSRAKAAARSAVEETGEQPPGVEAERVTSLSVRPAAG